jgi:hypothetical protein
MEILKFDTAEYVKAPVITGQVMIKRIRVGQKGAHKYRKIVISSLSYSLPRIIGSLLINQSRRQRTKKV